MEYRDIAVKTEVEEQIRANPKIISQIKTERGLAEYFGVSRTTVRRALNDLMMEGDVFQEDHHLPNHTVFEMNMLKMSSFTEECQKEDDVHIKIKVLSNDIIPMPTELNTFFKSNQRLIRIARQRLLNKTPLSYEISYLPSKKFKDLVKQDLNDVSLYEYLKTHFHVIPSHGREEIAYEVALNDKAKYLAITEGTPIYKVSSYSYDHDFEPFEHTDQYLIGNRFKYHLSAKNIFNYQEEYK